MEIYKNQIPQFILDYDTFLFHGTSNLYEAILDTGSLVGTRNVSFEQIEDILSLYKKINWYGNHSGGYAVLSSFSVADKNSNGKYLFLGETPHRCCLFASKKFAGGELIRSVFHSINDLIKYVNNEIIREKHKKQMVHDFPITGGGNILHIIQK